MDPQRNLLVIALLFISFLLFQQWQIDYGQPNHPPTAPAVVAVNVDVPSHNSFVVQSTAQHPQSRFITLESDVLSLTLDAQGGDIVQAKLLAYPRALNHPEPLLLLESTPKFIYQAQSGLIGSHGPDSNPSGRPLYHSAQTHYQLQDQQNSLQVVLTYLNPQGILFSKIFTLKRGDYALDVVHQVDNTTAQPIQVQLFGQLKQSVDLPKEKETGQSHFAAQAYRGAAYSTAEKRYQKYTFNDTKKHDLSQSSSGGWIAMLQQYFATAWIPSAEQTHHFYSKSINQHQYTLIGFKSPAVTVTPGAQQQLQATLWLGPEIQQKMAAVAKNLDLTVDYGWLWFISQPLFKLLKFLQGFVGNWGIAIILITFIVRGLMYPLTKAQYTSMAKMRALHPKLVAMRERFGDDRQRLSQEMMILYKKEQVNPLGGCLPLLIQMPIFLALYWMLMGSIELRHAPFAGWIRDLSAQDPYYLLPLLMGGTMFVIQKMSPSTVTDPLQQKVMNFMPILFTLFFLWFPSGLVLYYLVSNLVTILQQQMIYRHLEKKSLSS